MCKKIMNKKRISVLLVLLLLVTNIPVFALSFDESVENETLIVNNTNDICTELSQRMDTFILFYNNKVDDRTLVISQSQEDVMVAYYNDGRNIYEINDLPLLDFQEINNHFDIENLAEDIIEDIVNGKIINGNTQVVYTLDTSEISNDNEATIFGLNNARSEFYRKVGRGFSERNVASRTINNKRAVVYEAEDVSVEQIDRYVIFAGKTVAFLLSLLKLPPYISVPLGIATYFKDGVEFIKNDYTILEYNGFVEGYKDITVEGRVAHQVKSTYKYRLLENSGNDRVEISLLWGSQDNDYNNNVRLMETAVYNYR